MTGSIEFGREIRRRREAQGLTLEQLADRAGLTPNYIGTIENGKRDPSLSTVNSLASGLRISPAELFGGIKELSPSAMEAGLLFDVTQGEIQEAVLRILRSTARRRPPASFGSNPGLRKVG